MQEYREGDRGGDVQKAFERWQEAALKIKNESKSRGLVFINGTQHGFRTFRGSKLGSEIVVTTTSGVVELLQHGHSGFDLVSAAAAAEGTPSCQDLKLETLCRRGQI